MTCHYSLLIDMKASHTDQLWCLLYRMQSCDEIENTELEGESQAKAQTEKKKHGSKQKFDGEMDYVAETKREMER